MEMETDMETRHREFLEQYLTTGRQNGESTVTAQMVAPRGRARGQYEEEYSLVEIRIKGSEEPLSFMMKAGPTIAPHLVRSAKETGFFEMRNDEEALIIIASDVKSIGIKKITKGE